MVNYPLTCGSVTFRVCLKVDFLCHCPSYSYCTFLVAQLVKNPPASGRPGFNPWVGKIPWRRERLPTPVFWPREFHGLYKSMALQIWASLVAQTVKYLPAAWETRFDPWVRKITWRRKCQPIPVLLPEKSHGQRSLKCYSPWGCKESDMT